MERVEDELQEKSKICSSLDGLADIKQGCQIISLSLKRTVTLPRVYDWWSIQRQIAQKIAQKIANNKKLFWSEEDYLRLLGEDLVK